MEGVTPIQRRKLSYELLDRPQTRLHAGEWPPGAHLPSERKLMTAFGVWRPAIREALQSLDCIG